MCTSLLPQVSESQTQPKLPMDILRCFHTEFKLIQSKVIQRERCFVIFVLDRVISLFFKTLLCGTTRGGRARTALAGAFLLDPVMRIVAVVVPIPLLAGTTNFAYKVLKSFGGRKMGIKDLPCLIDCTIVSVVKYLCIQSIKAHHLHSDGSFVCSFPHFHRFWHFQVAIPAG